MTLDIFLSGCFEKSGRITADRYSFVSEKGVSDQLEHLSKMQCLGNPGKVQWLLGRRLEKKVDISYIFEGRRGMVG